MTKITLLALLLSFAGTSLAQEVRLTPEAITASQVSLTQNANTYTYIRCWYRPHTNHNDPSTDWEWAKNNDGSYYKVQGYWWSSVSFKNMFYSNTPHNEIKERCEKTLNVSHQTADITYFAADNSLSYNHSIWSNDSTTPQNKINRIVTFGDSLSDTGNIFNGSQWLFPNRNSWFLGHFSNGFVWTEYLAKAKNIPLYNWAVGGAAGKNKYIAITGVNEQVTSYLTYMKMAKNYKPTNTLFTLEFGLNDFMNYNHEVKDVKIDFSNALTSLIDSGANNILLFTLPDATKSPQFKYSNKDEITKVRSKIQQFNAFIKEQTKDYQAKGYNVALYDAALLFSQIVANPKAHGFENSTDACLDIKRSSSLDYLYSHHLTNDCAYYGSDAYVFWGGTHPTTAIHKYIAEKILQTSFNTFPFDSPSVQPINASASNVSVGRGKWVQYTQKLPAGYSTLTITTSGGIGDLDMYVQFGEAATRYQYSCRPYKNGNNETCTFNAPKTGTWYINLYGYQDASGVTLSVKATP
jgi:thermolabile hemolysin